MKWKTYLHQKKFLVLLAKDNENEIITMLKEAPLNRWAHGFAYNFACGINQDVLQLRSTQPLFQHVAHLDFGLGLHMCLNLYLYLY